MKEIAEGVLQAVDSGRAAALVTPVATEGSLPTGRQARMLVLAGGEILGTVGGGRMEAEAREAALGVIESRMPRLLQFSLTAQDALEDGLLCGGRATFFIEPIGAESREGFAALRRLAEGQRAGVEAIRLVEGEAVRRLVVEAGGEMIGSLGSEVLDQAVRAQMEELIEEDGARVEGVETEQEQVDLFIQALQPRPTVFLFGGGHVGLALARLVPTAGMRLVVIDDREEFCNRERFPMADEVHVCDFSTAFAELDIDRLSYAVVMTRGHQWDRQVVAQALRTSAGYVGMIGSRRKIGLTWEALKKEGFGDAELARVHAPIGLDIGGDTPGEIAVSIVAELIQVRRKGAGR